MISTEVVVRIMSIMVSVMVWFCRVFLGVFKRWKRVSGVVNWLGLWGRNEVVLNFFSEMVNENLVFMVRVWVAIGRFISCWIWVGEVFNVVVVFWS